MEKDQNPNRKQKDILRKYRTPYNPRENNFIEIDNQQREFFYQMESQGKKKK